MSERLEAFARRSRANRNLDYLISIKCHCFFCGVDN
jgi:hypothetical protein